MCTIRIYIYMYIYIYRWDVVHILQDISVSCYPWRHQGHQSQTLPHFQRRCFAFSPKSGTLLRLWMGSSFRHLPRTVWRPYRWPFGGSGGCSTFCEKKGPSLQEGMMLRRTLIVSPFFGIDFLLDLCRGWEGDNWWRIASDLGEPFQTCSQSVIAE